MGVWHPQLVLQGCHCSLSMVEHPLDLAVGGSQPRPPSVAGFGTQQKILAGEIIESEGGPVLNEASVRPESSSSCHKSGMKALLLGRSINKPPSQCQRQISAAFLAPSAGRGAAAKGCRELFPHWEVSCTLGCW